MSSGIIRPVLFGAVVALAASGYYGFTQHQKVNDFRAAHAALKAERDQLILKNDEVSRDAAKAKLALQEAEAKMATLQPVDAKKSVTR